MTDIALDGACHLEANKMRALKTVWIGPTWGYCFLLTAVNRLVYRSSAGTSGASWTGRTVVFSNTLFGEAGQIKNFDVFWEPWDPMNPGSELMHVVAVFIQNDGNWRWVYRTFDTGLETFTPDLSVDPIDITGEMPGAETDPAVTDLAIMRTSPSAKLVVGGWMGVGAFHLWRSLNGGANWFGSASPMPAQQFGTTILFKPMPNAVPFDNDDFMVIEQWHDIPQGPGGIALRQYDDSAFRVETADPLQANTLADPDYLTFDASIRNSDWNAVVVWLDIANGDILAEVIDSETLLHTPLTNVITGDTNVRTPNVVVDHLGHIHVFYYDISTDHILERVSTDGGVTWPLSAQSPMSTVTDEFRLVEMGDCLPSPFVGDTLLLPTWCAPDPTQDTRTDSAKGMVCDYPLPPSGLIEIYIGGTVFIADDGTYDFGTVTQQPGKPIEVQFQIFNAGSEVLNATSIAMAGADYSLLIDPTPVALNPKETADFTVELDRSILGTKVGSVTVFNDSPPDTNVYLINLTAEVVAVPVTDPICYRYRCRPLRRVGDGFGLTPP